MTKHYEPLREIEFQVLTNHRSTIYHRGITKKLAADCTLLDTGETFTIEADTWRELDKQVYAKYDRLFARKEQA